MLAERKYGKAPCQFSWLAFGSQARQEQVLGSDQDNGLLLPDDVEIDSIYFTKLTEFVNDGLDSCGMPYCPGDVMANNDKWRQPLNVWKNYFENWIKEPAPIGFFKTFVLESDGDHNHTLNLKKRGTIPIVDIARNYALSASLEPLNTIERLKRMEQAGVMSKEMAYSLIDAHEFIAGIRLDAQGKQYRAGVTVDNYLDPKELSPLLRHQLKDAFNVVREAQTAMRMRFGGGVI